MPKTSSLESSLHYMKYLQQGLAVHTNNLNKSVIPGEKAEELKPFKEQLGSLPAGKIHRTNHMHLTSKGVAAGGFAVQKNTSVSESLSGGTISREEEISKINDITTEALKTTKIIKKQYAFLHTILGTKG
jgi:flagellar basal body rod protein FlgB